MNFADWSKRTGILPTHPTSETGAISVISYSSLTPHHADLWHLDDYTVSSVCGSVVWLMPRIFNVYDSFLDCDNDVDYDTAVTLFQQSDRYISSADAKAMMHDVVAKHRTFNCMHNSSFLSRKH